MSRKPGTAYASMMPTMVSVVRNSRMRSVFFALRFLSVARIAFLSIAYCGKIYKQSASHIFVRRFDGKKQNI